MNKFLLVFVCLLGTTIMAQAQLNQYKYVVVPTKFGAFKKENQYKTSTLIKHLFTEEGFETAYEENLPPELEANRCMGLWVDLIDDSGMFQTKTKLELKNCRSEKVFETQEGSSRIKAYPEAYAESIRASFNSISMLNYSYDPPREGLVATPPIREVPPATKTNMPDPQTVEQQATPTQQKYKSAEPQPATGNLQKAAVPTAVVAATPAESMEDITQVTLYAQEQDYGYQLVDSTPKIRLRLHKGASPDVYLAEVVDTGIQGMVRKSGDKWVLEYLKDGKSVSLPLNIKF